MASPFQWALFIGPAWHPVGHPSHFDWTGISQDIAYTLDYSTMLASTLSSGTASMELVNATSFPAAGGLWIGPNGSGQAWEYIEYTDRSGNTLTGLVREDSVDREHNGIHSAGATVRAWWKVTGNDGRLRHSWSLDDKLVASDWQFEVSGIKAPQAAFRPFHLAAVQYRTAVSGNLLTLFVGIFDSSTIQDDSKRIRSWSARIVSVAGLLKKLKASGVRVGEFDAVQHGSAESSAPLTAAYKERVSGDFVAASPSFEAQAVLEDEDTIWIADEMVGAPEPVGSYSGFSQLYINPPLSVNGGYRWLEIVNRNMESTALRVWRASDDQEWTMNFDYDATGKRLILAENPTRFQEANPSARPDTLVNIETEDDPNFFNKLDPAGGALAIVFFDSESDVIAWGNQTGAPGWVNTSNGWNGPPMPAPKPGETMRWKPLDHGHTNTKDDWEVGMNQSPGYQIKNDGDDVWIAVELPGLGLVLHDDISSVSPASGSTLYIDGQNGPSTDGLPASGTLVIGDERITYSAKVAGGVTVTARGADGTTATAHAAGDAIFVLHSQGGKTAITDALPIISLSWERNGGVIYPRDFVWRYSMLPARTPAESRHENDYELSATITNHASSSHTHGLTDRRVKSVLIEFKKMTVDPARPRLNRIRALVDPAHYDSSHWLSAGQTIEALIRQIGLNVGLPPASITAASGGATPGGFVTAVDSAWAVMVSAAEMGGSTIQVRRDGKIATAPDSFWGTSVGGYSPSHTWTRDNASKIELIRTGGGLVSQVRITWERPDGNDGGIAKYPSTPDTMGMPQEIGPYYFANQVAADLAARKRYFLTRYPYEIGITLAEGDLTVQPRQVHRLHNWALADDMQSLDRMMLVMMVEHYIEGQTLHTALYGIQIDRESDG